MHWLGREPALTAPLSAARASAAHLHKQALRAQHLRRQQGVSPWEREFLIIPVQLSGALCWSLPEQQKRPGAKGSVTFTPGVQGEPLLRQHDLFWHWSEKQQSSEVWQLPSVGGTQGRQPLTGPTPTQCLSQPAGRQARAGEQP